MAFDRYNIKIRDKNFKIVWADLDDIESLEWIDRFNMPGDFQLIVSKASAAASLLVQGNGLIVVDAIAGVTLWSGPIQTVTRTRADNTLTVSGSTDLVWLKRRQAWPITGAQSYYQVAKGTSPVRWYRMGDLSGTTCHDWGSDAKDGTYTNSPTLQQSGPIYYDTNASTLFVAANSQYVTCGAGGAIPTGNSSWTCSAWIYMTAYPPANGWIVGWGTAATHKSGGIFITSAGLARASTFNGDTTGGAALSLNAWHLISATWDGTTLSCFVDGAAYGATATPGAMTTNATPPVTIGARVDAPGGGQFFNGYISEVLIWAGLVATSTYTPGANTSGRGLNQQQFDTQSGVASTLIFHYVQHNLGSAAQIDRWPGDATNIARNALTMATDPAVGSSLKASARYDNLLALCQLLAVASTPELGFKCVQTASGVLTFTIYQPTDRSLTMVLRDTDGTLADYTYTQDVPTENFLIVGGSGTSTARTLQTVFDRNTLAAFGRIEAFLNQTGTSDATTLTTVGTDKLTRDLSANAVDTSVQQLTNLRYGVNYALGDKITVTMEQGGIVVTDVVREVHGYIDQEHGAYINPVVGSQDAAQARNEFRDMIRQLKAQGLALGYLEQVQ